MQTIMIMIKIFWAPENNIEQNIFFKYKNILIPSKHIIYNFKYFFFDIY